MVTYEQAKAKALKANSNINKAYEMKNAYLFAVSGGKVEDDNEVVILKSNGNSVTYSDYIITYKDSNKKSIKF